MPWPGKVLRETLPSPGTARVVPSRQAGAGPATPAAGNQGSEQWSDSSGWGCRATTSGTPHSAGTASSFLGFYTTILGALCGFLIGQSFDGTVLPVALGYAGLGALALLVVAWTERGRLFRGGVSG